MLIIKYYNSINESLFRKRFRIERYMLFEDKESKYIKNMIRNNCDDYYKQYSVLMKDREEEWAFGRKSSIAFALLDD